MCLVRPPLEGQRQQSLSAATLRHTGQVNAAMSDCECLLTLPSPQRLPATDNYRVSPPDGICTALLNQSFTLCGLVIVLSVKDFRINDRR
jgi:hypothetical protein